MVLRRARSVTRDIGRGGPRKLRLFWALKWLREKINKSFLSFAASSPSFLFLNRLITVSPSASLCLSVSSFYLLLVIPLPFFLCLYSVYSLFLLEGLIYLSPSPWFGIGHGKPSEYSSHIFQSMGMPFFTEGREQDEDWLLKKTLNDQNMALCVYHLINCIQKGEDVDAGM
jgi:hypothetical protein